MLYCIYHQFPLAKRFDFGVDENFVERVVIAYLRGKSEITYKGRDYSIGSTALQIYEVTSDLGSQKQVQDFFNQIGYVYEGLLEKYCLNVTDRFLLDREWGELREDFYNIYINDGEKKPIITVVNKKEVLFFLEEYSKGNTEIPIVGRTISLKNPKTIKIFSIDFKWLSKDRGKIKEEINKIKNVFGKWSLDVLKQFGTEVTSNFDVKPFGFTKNNLQNNIRETSMTRQHSKTKVFISHSSKDKDLIDNFVQRILRLALDISKNEIFCTSIEGMGINTGEDFRSKIKERITNSDIIILMLSQPYKESEICQNEMGAAWVLNSKVIPIIIPPLTFKDIGPLHITDHIDKINTPQGIDNIIHTLTECLNIKISDIRNFNKHRDDFLRTADVGSKTKSSDKPINPPVFIISGTYEWSKGQKDVTESLRQLVNNGTFQGKVEPNTFGIPDPCFGEVKTLKVHYKLNGNEKTIIARDSQIFDFL